MARAATKPVIDDAAKAAVVARIQEYRKTFPVVTEQDGKRVIDIISLSDVFRRTDTLHHALHFGIDRNQPEDGYARQYIELGRAYAAAVHWTDPSRRQNLELGRQHLIALRLLASTFHQADTVILPYRTNSHPMNADLRKVLREVNAMEGLGDAQLTWQTKQYRTPKALAERAPYIEDDENKRTAFIYGTIDYKRY
jgi:hypothetical protein